MSSISDDERANKHSYYGRLYRSWFTDERWREICEKFEEDLEQKSFFPRGAKISYASGATQTSRSDFCDSCLYPANDFIEHVDDRLCARCRAVFWTAETLFDEKTTDEAEIISTMSFAAWNGRPWELKNEDARERFVNDFSRKCGEFELVRLTVDGVPVLRLKAVVADVVWYEGTDVPKQVRIRVRSKFAKPKEDVADLYEQTLLAENLPWDQSTCGSIEWENTAAQLSITIGPGKTYRPGRVRLLAKNLPERWLSFPPPKLVEEFYAALLGSTHKKTRRGYAYALGRQGRPTTKAKEAKNVILASVAWYIGERDQEIKPKERRPRIARMLNRHLLGPMEESGEERDFLHCPPPEREPLRIFIQ